MAVALGGLGIAFLAFGVIAIGAIIYWSLSGVMAEKRQQRDKK